MAAFLTIQRGNLADAKQDYTSCCCAALLCVAASAHALTPEQAKAIAIGESDARIDALRAAVAGADDKTVAFIQALSDDAVKVVAGKPVIVKDDKAVDPVSGAETALPDTAEDVMNNNRMRGELDTALAVAQAAVHRRRRCARDAVKTLQGEVDESKLPLMDKAFAAGDRARPQGPTGLAARRRPAEQRRQRPSAWKPPRCWPTARRPPPRPC